MIESVFRPEKDFHLDCFAVSFVTISEELLCRIQFAVAASVLLFSVLNVKSIRKLLLKLSIVINFLSGGRR